VLVGEPLFEATPSVDLDGIPGVRAGAVLTVTLTTEVPVDTTASTVSLSGIELRPVDGQAGVWSHTLDGTEGDGLKDLDARLYDSAGNPLRVQRQDIVRFDFTPPSGACFVTPEVANGEEDIEFSV